MDEPFNGIIKEYRKLQPLFRVTSRCPVCGSYSLIIEEILYEVPYFGKIIISTGKCSNCGYKYSDVRTAESRGPQKIVVKVTGEKELRYLLIKSALASIYIREKGYKITPGPASTGFITTIEGILHRIHEVLEIICKEDANACREHKKWIKQAIEGKTTFTLVICDPEGTSKVIGDNVQTTPLDEECKAIQQH
ncbi:MAG: ZPR1 zinc finger domain-containing protein [Desulfurococcales archaeon]|nr:ZPR1 zinc finger domain-containing protein [Desulfurococcales archaeon]